MDAEEPEAGPSRKRRKTLRENDLEPSPDQQAAGLEPRSTKQIFPFIHFDELERACPPDGKPPHSLPDIARCYLLTHGNSSNGVSADVIAEAISTRFGYYRYGQGERWEKTLREYMHLFDCFIVTKRRGAGKESTYKCDPHIDPKLKAEKQKPRLYRTLSDQYSSANTASRATSVDPLPSNDNGGMGVDSRPLKSTSGMLGIHSDAAQSPTVRASSTAPEGQESCRLTLETSEVFEKVVTHLGSRVYYCMKCGPTVIYRRRQDSMFHLAHLVRIIKLLHGSKPSNVFLQEMIHKQKQKEVPSSRQNESAFISIQSARRLALECGIESELSAILDESLPQVSDSVPLTRISPRYFLRPELICRYCKEPFHKMRQLQDHLSSLTGTCQLLHGAQLSQLYLEEIDAAIVERANEEDGFSNGGALIRQNWPLNEAFKVRSNLHDSYVVPSLLLWTASEKEKCFWALKRYGRYQPDLIAEHIGSKTTSDVVCYLASLHREATNLDSAKEQRSGNGESSDSDKDGSAREMSEKWVEFEESLSTDLSIWESFTVEAASTPWHLRDHAQAALMRPDGFFECKYCFPGTCDGMYPVCGRCEQEGKTCRWHEGSRTVSGLEGQPDVKEALEDLYSRPAHTESDIISHCRSQLLGKMSWYHLSAIKPPNRRQLTIKQSHGNTSEREESKAPALMRPSHARKAESWSDIPLSYVPALERQRLQDSGLSGVEEEMFQAKRQVQAVGLAARDLGVAGDIFDLQKMGVLMEYDTLDTAHISSDSLRSLHSLVRDYVSAVVFQVACLIEAKHNPEVTKSVVEEAIRLHELNDEHCGRLLSREEYLRGIRKRLGVSYTFLPQYAEANPPPFRKPRISSGYLPDSYNTSWLIGPEIGNQLVSPELDQYEYYEDLKELGWYTILDESYNEVVEDELDDPDNHSTEDVVMAEDKKLNERDRLQDHLYEEALWNAYASAGNVSTDELLSFNATRQDSESMEDAQTRVLYLEDQSDRSDSSHLHDAEESGPINAGQHRQQVQSEESGEEVMKSPIVQGNPASGSHSSLIKNDRQDNTTVQPSRPHRTGHRAPTASSSDVRSASRRRKLPAPGSQRAKRTSRAIHTKEFIDTSDEEDL